MKIGISAFAADGGKSGISQYMRAVFDQLAVLAPDDRFVLYMTNSDRSFFSVERDNVEIVSYPDWFGHPIVSIFWHLLCFPWALFRRGCQCAFLPAGNRRLGWWYGVPSVSTVHDLSQLHVPQKYDRLRMFYITQVLPAMMRRLTRVVSISQSTRRDLESFARVASERIRVVYNGVDVSRFDARSRGAATEFVKERFGIDAPYVLYVSRLEHPGKNHVRLVGAMKRLRDAGHPHQLVLVGNRWAGAEAIDRAIVEQGMADDVVFPGFVPDEDLPMLYAAADLFVFPSLFEGFGIPPLEAMAVGTPVCASNRGSIPEVVGDAALLYDPEDEEAIAQSMQRVLGDDAVADELRRRGFEQAKRFTWATAAEGVMNTCREAVR
ncbi:MAG: glycosyltransferase family 4 protein [Gammaproteobacteria bacterium]|nr:glycosyltransferase family 4 protein [Gammaproteobacteria bacterium]